MEKEDGVCSLELAMRLKKLKVKQKSIYHWARLDERKPYDDFELVDLFENEKKKYPHSFTERISAFTVAELGERLPFNVKVKRKNEDLKVYRLRLQKHKNQWGIGYYYAVDVALEIPIYEDTLANTMAMMLIYLLENKLIKEG